MNWEYEEAPMPSKMHIGMGLTKCRRTKVRGRYKRKPPCIEDAYWNGADEMPPNEGEGAIQQEEAPMHRRCILEWG